MATGVLTVVAFAFVFLFWALQLLLGMIAARTVQTPTTIQFTYCLVVALYLLRAVGWLVWP